MNGLSRLTTPNEPLPYRMMQGLILFWVVVWLFLWVTFRPAIFPSPVDVVRSLPDLWFEQGLGQELFASLRVNLEALLLSSAIALPLAYLSKTPVVQPLAMGFSKLRFLSPAVFFLLLLFIAPSGHWLKLLMLTSGMAGFLLTGMLDVVATIPSEKLDDARTLRMSEWQVTWYVVVRGTVAPLLDQLRGNAAMGWGMLMMVEGIVRSEGGIGVLLVDLSKHMSFASVYGIALAVVAVGLAQDWALQQLKAWWCPYALMATR